MSFLLNTNVLSELRRGRRCDPRVRSWAASVPQREMHTSVVVLGELKRGIERVRPKDARFAAELERWLMRVISFMGTRILPVDQVVALTWWADRRATNGAADRRSARRNSDRARIYNSHPQREGCGGSRCELPESF